MQERRESSIPDIVRAIARPGRGRKPSEVIHSLTEKGADPCKLRRETHAYVVATGGPSSRLIGSVADAFAEHDADSLFGPAANNIIPRQDR